MPVHDVRLVSFHTAERLDVVAHRGSLDVPGGAKEGAALVGCAVEVTSADDRWLLRSTIVRVEPVGDKLRVTFDRRATELVAANAGM